MSDSKPTQAEDMTILPPSTEAAPPPLPGRQPGFFKRLFMSKKKQQALAVQNGYMEIVDLVRAMRSHLDHQQTVQTQVLSLLNQVPDAMERSQEVMTLLKEQIAHGSEHNQKLTESMGQLSTTLSALDESQRGSSRTIADLIHRSRESEALLREVMRRSERRTTCFLVLFFLLIAALGFYFVKTVNPDAFRWPVKAAEPAAVVVVEEIAAPVEGVEDVVAVPEDIPVVQEAAEEAAADVVPEPPKKKSRRKKAAEKPAEAPAVVEPAADAAQE